MRGGSAVLDEVPSPAIEPNMVLVAVDHSCISVGTELSGLRSGGIPLWKRALKQPDNVRKAVQAAKSVGWRRTWGLVHGKLSAGNPAGYSAAGVVLEVGSGIRDIMSDDRVACAGAQFAHHAEIIRVPRNLLAPIPAELGFAEASTVTLGAIALQGVRRAAPTLGETFVVLGLGILGQLVCQLLKVNGIRVIGTDIEPSRVELARESGADLVVNPSDVFPDQQVARLTNGVGADGVIITAASPSDTVVSTAFKMCRKKGRVVLVGDVGLALTRSDFYAKEIDFLISSSYGPGRYDRTYEEEGVDYPVAYVRWTENRNMEEYLRLVASGQVRLAHLPTASFPLEQVADAFAVLQGKAPRPVLVWLSYPGLKLAPAPQEKFMVRSSGGHTGRIGIALVGAGAFAKQMHLPNILAMPHRFNVRAVVSRTGHNAAATAKQCKATYATTRYHDVLEDDAVDAVVITTRHHLHAAMVLEALDAGKHVFVEKPLCLTTDELDQIRGWFAGKDDQDVPVLLTGFNRRFSPYALAVRGILRDRSNPFILNYRMNAGYVPPDHWVLGGEGGGRNLGEACHIYDLGTAFTGTRVQDVSAKSIVCETEYYSPGDNFLATCRFDDGSLLSLCYTALGNAGYPKEQMDLFVDGKVISMSDYRDLKVVGARGLGVHTRLPDKGHKAELVAFADAIQGHGDWPIPLWEQCQAMEIALAVEHCIRGDT